MVQFSLPSQRGMVKGEDMYVSLESKDSIEVGVSMFGE